MKKHGIHETEDEEPDDESNTSTEDDEDGDDTPDSEPTSESETRDVDLEEAMETAPILIPTPAPTSRTITKPRKSPSTRRRARITWRWREAIGVIRGRARTITVAFRCYDGPWTERLTKMLGRLTRPYSSTTTRMRTNSRRNTRQPNPATRRVAGRLSGNVTTPKGRRNSSK